MYKGEWPTSHRKDCCLSLIAQLCQHSHSLQVRGFLVLNFPLPGSAVQYSVSILSECPSIDDTSTQQLMKVKNWSVKQRRAFTSANTMD